MWVESMIWNFMKDNITQKKLEFIPKQLEESKWQKENPARGWYAIYPFEIEKKINPEELKWSLRQKQSVVLVLLDIHAYKDRPLDFFALENFKNILKFFKKYKKDVVLRPVYDRKGEGLEREPNQLQLICKHLKQIRKVLEEEEHTVFVFQGLLIGSWGEMHTSKYLTRQCLQALYKCIRPMLSSELCLAVRTPAIWRKLVKEQEYRSGKFLPITLFNDAIFGSSNDLGTFGRMTGRAAGWEEAWVRTEELVFEDKICAMLPFGGEVLSGKAAIPIHHQIKEMKKMHLSYLNSTYDLKRLDKWKKEIWEDFDGMSVYDYIGEHLGYRFVVTNVQLQKEKDFFGKWNGTLEIENKGFGACCQSVEIVLTIKGKEKDEKISYPLDFNLRFLKAGEKKSISFTLPGKQEEGILYVEARRKKDGMPIYFANKNAENLCLGTLRTKIVE